MKLPMTNILNTIYTSVWLGIYLGILIVFIFSLISFAAYLTRKRNEKKMAYNLTFLQIRLPPDNEIEIEVAENMFMSLMGFGKGFWKSLFTGQYRIAFEIVSKVEGIAFYVVVPDEIASLVEKQINAAYPTAEIDIIDPEEIWDRGKFTTVTELKLRGPSYYPLKVYEDMKNDSLSATTSAMSKMKDNEVLAVQYIIQPAPDTWRLGGRGFISSVKNKASDPEKKSNIDTAFLEGVEKKISHPGFYTKVRIVSIAEDKFTSDLNTKNVLSSFEQFTDVSYNKFVKRKFIPNFKLIHDFIYRRMDVFDITIPILGIQIYSNVSVLNVIEMATVFHFPNKDVGTPNIVWLTAKRSQAPVVIPGSGLYLGKSRFRGVNKKIFMESVDRTRHLYIVGQTGTGKSQMMMMLALQDIRNGEGIAIIDPHGTDIEELLTKIPPERMDDVILFNAADTERPFGINMIEAHSEEEKHMLINSFIALLYKLYDPNHQGIMGPLLERAIRNVMLTAMVDPEATMVDVMRLLIDDKYHKRFLDKLTDPMVKRYWTDEVANTSQNRKGETMGYFVAKFDRFITDITMRNILGQAKSSVDLNKVMSEKKILLVDLAKGKIGEENSTFLGLLLVPRLLSAALARHSMIVRGEDFPDFYLYVDEFQNFATPDFATILSEARKYKLNLVVGHQFIAQLDDAIKNAVFGNAGTICTFRVGADDAEYLEKQYEPVFTKSDLINLPIGNCYTRLLVKGQPTMPFSMEVDWDWITNQPKNFEAAKKIKEMSRMKYGVPAEEVEEYVKLRAGYNEQPEVPPLPTFNKSRIPF
jgi:hypothetical protein